VILNAHALQFVLRSQMNSLCQRSDLALDLSCHQLRHYDLMKFRMTNVRQLSSRNVRRIRAQGLRTKPRLFCSSTHKLVFINSVEQDIMRCAAGWVVHSCSVKSTQGYAIIVSFVVVSIPVISLHFPLMSSGDSNDLSATNRSRAGDIDLSSSLSYRSRGTRLIDTVSTWNKYSTASATSG
jgi:hypothetical protein